MRISVSEGKALLTDLVRRAEAGEEVVLTRHGRPAVKLVPIRQTGDAASRRRLLESLRDLASMKAAPGETAARSQDDLYDEHGLPR